MVHRCRREHTWRSNGTGGNKADATTLVEAENGPAGVSSNESMNPMMNQYRIVARQRSAPTDLVTRVEPNSANRGLTKSLAQKGF
jgi:hypothetical protein